MGPKMVAFPVLAVARGVHVVAKAITSIARPEIVSFALFTSTQNTEE